MKRQRFSEIVTFRGRACVNKTSVNITAHQSSKYRHFTQARDSLGFSQERACTPSH